MPSKRYYLVFLITLFLSAVLLGRFFYLQVYSGKRLAKAASYQRMADSEIEKPRSDVVDRNNIPFTNRFTKTTIVLKPLMLRGKDEDISSISEIIGQDFRKIRQEIETRREPIMIQSDQVTKDKLLGLGINGVSAINSLMRYDSSTVAKHVIGYLNRSDQTGETGVEKSYEEVLRFKEKSIVGVITDARKNAVQGLGYRLIADESRKNKLNVKLTLDYHIQKITEEVMDRSGMAGAVVVEDTGSGDILAMTSKPDFNQNEVLKYLHSSQNELFNRAVASYNLGSVFKIIDIAQYLESRAGNDGTYFCNGYIMVGDKEFKCSAYESGGHGRINMEEAFAVSCNPYFINLGLKLGSRNLVDMARKFGLGSITGIKEQGIDEASGNLPNINRDLLDGDTANISIGQGNIMVTPLQVADMVAAVANGGIKNRINIVDCIVDGEGNKVRNMRRKEATRVISLQTSERLREMMGKVTDSGTGTKANLDEYGGSAGKTGSAEAVINGRKAVHAWFAGFFPQRTPRYAIAVFIEDGKSGGQAAAPIFAEIAREMARKGYR